MILSIKGILKSYFDSLPLLYTVYVITTDQNVDMFTCIENFFLVFQKCINGCQRAVVELHQQILTIVILSIFPSLYEYNSNKKKSCLQFSGGKKKISKDKIDRFRL